MAEWSKAAVLKTVECNSSVGSNPTPSAILVDWLIGKIGLNVSGYDCRVLPFDKSTN